MLSSENGGDGTLHGLLTRDVGVVAAGASVLADALAEQAVPVEAVDWRPPAGDATLAGDLAMVMGDSRRAAANETAVRRLLDAHPYLVDVRPAREVLGLEPGTFLHAGPPLTWERASGPIWGSAAKPASVATDSAGRARAGCAPGPARAVPASWPHAENAAATPTAATTDRG